ncbi:MAG: hypothetical protein RR231_12210 [Acinetobacter sp.]
MNQVPIFFCKELLNLTAYTDTQYQDDCPWRFEPALELIFKKKLTKYKKLLCIICVEHPHKASVLHYFLAALENNKPIHTIPLGSNSIDPTQPLIQQSAIQNAKKSYLNRSFRADKTWKPTSIKELLEIPEWPILIDELTRRTQNLSIQEYLYDPCIRFYHTNKNKLRHHPNYAIYKEVLTHLRLSGSFTTPKINHQYHWPYCYFLANQGIEDRPDLVIDCDYLGEGLALSNSCIDLYKLLRESSLIHSTNIRPIFRSEIFRLNEYWIKKES